MAISFFLDSIHKLYGWPVLIFPFHLGFPDIAKMNLIQIVVILSFGCIKDRFVLEGAGLGAVKKRCLFLHNNPYPVFILYSYLLSLMRLICQLDLRLFLNIK
ncbi:MAG: hypothetical protein EB127_11975 [Alphaproteobacteria bacterium]|nr:hypothetical protein [Alphaproteobacteria bacterium]